MARPDATGPGTAAPAKLTTGTFKPKFRGKPCRLEAELGALYGVHWRSKTSTIAGSVFFFFFLVFCHMTYIMWIHIIYFFVFSCTVEDCISVQASRQTCKFACFGFGHPPCSFASAGSCSLSAAVLCVAAILLSVFARPRFHLRQKRALPLRFVPCPLK